MLATLDHGCDSQSKFANAVVAGIDRSAWLSWCLFGVGFSTAAGPLSAVMEDRVGLLLVAGSSVAFFALVAAIQAHMRLSLSAASFGAPRQLVTGGVFRFSRNPIYVAFFLPLASLGWYSLPVAVAVTAVYVTAMNRFVIRHEEAHLTALFGKAYADYRAATPRWLV